jgi:DNA-directed RNA polymerase specialized sigma24 family protein
MSVGYVIPVDPSELANRFSGEEENLEFMLDELSVDAYEELDEDRDLPEGYEARVEALLDRLPEREADLIELYYLKKKRQADIATIFEVTQAAISYRLDRGIQRIKFLLSIPEVTEEDLRKDLSEVLPLLDINILVGMWHTTCQSEVAAQLDLTQGRVRHRFFKAVKAIEKAAAENSKYEPYKQIFSTIAEKKKFNILREVRLPQWSNRGGDAIT